VTVMVWRILFRMGGLPFWSANIETVFLRAPAADGGRYKGGPAGSRRYEIVEILRNFRLRGLPHMCRNIRTLFNFEPPVTEEEIRAASLQFVRKITGFNKPSKANEAAFRAGVDEIAAVSGRLLRSLETTSEPKNREEEAAKARARDAARYGD
jgi:hypothetical protein